jgi:hypothetical protein
MQQFFPQIKKTEQKIDFSVEKKYIENLKKCFKEKLIFLSQGTTKKEDNKGVQCNIYDICKKEIKKLFSDLEVEIDNMHKDGYVLVGYKGTNQKEKSKFEKGLDSEYVFTKEAKQESNTGATRGVGFYVTTSFSEAVRYAKIAARSVCKQSTKSSKLITPVVNGKEKELDFFKCSYEEQTCLYDEMIRAFEIFEWLKYAPEIIPIYIKDFFAIRKNDILFLRDTSPFPKWQLLLLGSVDNQNVFIKNSSKKADSKLENILYFTKNNSNGKWFIEYKKNKQDKLNVEEISLTKEQARILGKNDKDDQKTELLISHFCCQFQLEHWYNFSYVETEEVDNRSELKFNPKKAIYDKIKLGKVSISPIFKRALDIIGKLKLKEETIDVVFTKKLTPEKGFSGTYEQEYSKIERYEKEMQEISKNIIKMENLLPNLPSGYSKIVQFGVNSSTRNKNLITILTAKNTLKQ